MKNKHVSNVEQVWAMHYNLHNLIIVILEVLA